VFRGPLPGTYRAEYSPDGNRLAVTHWGRIVWLWDSRTGRELLALRGHQEKVNRAAFCADGRVATASNDKTVRIWDDRTGRELLCLRGHTQGVARLTFSADGERLVSVGYERVVKVWDAHDGRELLSV